MKIPSPVPFEKSNEDVIADLAELSPLDYDAVRKARADQLGIRVVTLDSEVERLRPKDVEDDGLQIFEAVEPWPEPVDGAALLANIRMTIQRFCVLPDHSDTIMAAWVLHAWAHNAADISPILAFVSPEKRCGKTTALSVIGALVPKTMHSINVTTAVLFRVVEMYRPTVLIDEADTFLDGNDELRGIINGGHNRLSAVVWRTVGDNHDPKPFNVWAPKSIAMIGKLPDTLEDRALVIPLRRKQQGESVERFRFDKVEEFLPLRRRAQRWANDNIPSLNGMDPKVPESLNDRAQDNARAILAIADHIGGIWPDEVRSAFVGLEENKDDEPQSDGILLLRDIQGILGSGNHETILSKDLLEGLCELEESPWAEWRMGKRISLQGIAKLLKPYGVTPERDRNSRFYRISAFQDAFERYLSDIPQNRVTSDTTVTNKEKRHENPNNINGGDACDGGDGCSEGDSRHSTQSQYEPRM